MATGPWRRRLPALLLGAAAGFASGMLGIGGGLVVGPVLASTGMELPLALGTAVAVVVPIAGMGVIVEGLTRPEHLVLWVALLLALGGQMGVLGGARLLQRMPERSLRAFYALVLAGAGLRSLGVGGAVPAEALQGVAGAGPFDLDAATAARGALALGVGAVAGLCAALFGIGGGLVAVPGMVYLVGGFDFHHAAGTSLLAMVPTAARAAVVALRQGRVEKPLASRLALAALAAAAAAVWLRNLAVAPQMLARLFGAFLCLAAGHQLKTALRSTAAPPPARRQS